MKGLVVDQDGDPLPGVSIVLENPSLGFRERGAVTDPKGEFRFIAIPPGPGYRLKASLAAHQTVVFHDLEILRGANVLPGITLRPALTERVQVQGRADVVQTQSATTSTTISSEFLTGLPVLGRDYQDILTLAPGVTDVNNTGNPNIHGARDTDVVTLVDGVNTTDPFTGLYGQELNVESIEEIEVITAGATAEFSRASGGFVNIITKSGGNEFKGTFKFFMQTSRVDGDGAGTDPVEIRGGLGETDGFRDMNFTNLYPFLSLSGAFITDRLWYYFAPEYLQIEDPINAGTQSYIATTRALRATGKVTWQIASSNKLAFIVLYDDTTEENLGLGSRVSLESGYSFNRGGPTLTLLDTAIVSPNFSLETTLSRFDQSFSLTPSLDADTNGNGILHVDGVSALGGNNDGFMNARERDPGEDYDRDGHYDVFEDFDGSETLSFCVLDPVTLERICAEDRDRDNRLTPDNGCEGGEREDLNCNGVIDAESDFNHNGQVDPAEDTGIPCDSRLYCPDGYEPGTRGNGAFDSEDRDGSGSLDTLPGAGDTAFPFWADANGNSRPDPGEYESPTPPDRDYVLNQNSNRIDGPFYFDYADSRTRDTVKEDLSFYVDDFFGSHDIKAGLAFEREGFDRTTHQRSFLQVSNQGVDRDTGRVGGTVGTFLPTDGTVYNSASGDHFGFFVQDSYKPLPNLTVGLGLRFDREEIHSHGFEFFEPADQRRDFDLLMALKGVEVQSGDLNSDGVFSRGLKSDPLYYSLAGHFAAIESALGEAAPMRFTRHNFMTSIETARLADFGIENPLLLLNGRPRQAEEILITNNNIAPRLSLSYDPGADGKSKIFASWGRFYGNLFLETVVGEEGPDTISPYYAYDSDGVDFFGVPDNQIGRRISFSPPSAFQVDRELRTPFTDELTAGFLREIAPEVAVSFTYVRRDYRDQLQDVDVNHDIRRPPFCSPEKTLPSGYCDAFGLTLVPMRGLKNAPFERVPDGYPDLYINNFNFNQIFRVGNYNYQAYTSYEVQITRRLQRKWQMDASYVFSKATGQAESFLSESGDDPALTELKSGYLDYDQRHVAKFHVVSYLPADWQLGGSIIWSSGLPFSFVNRFQSGDNVDFTQTRRLFGRRDPSSNYFMGELRNTHRNHSAYDINVRTQKNLVIGNVAAGVFFEIFNLLNVDTLRVYEIDNRVVNLQSEEERRFGRRFQFGVQLDF